MDNILTQFYKPNELLKEYYTNDTWLLRFSEKITKNSRTYFEYPMTSTDLEIQYFILTVARKIKVL